MRGGRAVAEGWASTVTAGKPPTVSPGPGPFPWEGQRKAAGGWRERWGLRHPRFPGRQPRSARASQVETPPPAVRGAGEEGLGSERPPLHLSHGRRVTKTTALAKTVTSGREPRALAASPLPMEDSFLESFGRLSLQQRQQQPPPRPPPARGPPPRRHSFRKHLYLLRGLPGSGKTTLAR